MERGGGGGGGGGEREGQDGKREVQNWEHESTHCDPQCQ